MRLQIPAPTHQANLARMVDNFDRAGQQLIPERKARPGTRRLSGALPSSCERVFKQLEGGPDGG